MKELFQIYLMSLLRPFATQERLRVQREAGMRNSPEVISLFGEAPQVNEFETDSSLTFVDAMCMSWTFSILKAVYAIIAMLIGLEWLGVMGQEGGYLEELKFWSNRAQTITVFMIILEVILFPLTLWFYAKFWGVVIRFFGDVFDVKGDCTNISEQIVNHSLSSHFFLIIPIFRELAKHVSSLMLIYAGLKRNMGLSTIQSLIVLLSPVMLLLFIIFLTLLYIVLMISFI
jgi:hypothetical protein